MNRVTYNFLDGDLKLPKIEGDLYQSRSLEHWTPLMARTYIRICIEYDLAKSTNKNDLLSFIRKAKETD